MAGYIFASLRGEPIVLSYAKRKTYDITRVDVFEVYKEDSTLYCKLRSRGWDYGVGGNQ